MESGKKIDKLERRKRTLLDMRADGEITKEEYAARKAGYEQELDQLGALAAEAEAEAETAGRFLLAAGKGPVG